MNYQDIEYELNCLAKTPGVIACALVAIDTGMVYLSSSNLTNSDTPSGKEYFKQEEFEIIAEGARDYWVLHQKNGNVFDALGPLGNIVVRHKYGLLSIRACGHTMLLIAIAKIKEVDWKQWPAQVNQLCNRVEALEVEK